jgi:hypothetical protein
MKVFVGIKFNTLRALYELDTKTGGVTINHDVSKEALDYLAITLPMMTDAELDMIHKFNIKQCFGNQHL